MVAVGLALTATVLESAALQLLASVTVTVYVVVEHTVVEGLDTVVPDKLVEGTHA